MATPLATAFVRVRADTTGFRTDVEGAARTHGRAYGKAFALAAGGAITATAAIVTAGLVKAVGAARALNLVPLQQAAKNAGISWAAFSGQLDKSYTSMQRLGFAQSDVNQAMTKLVTATQSQSLSLRTLGATADYARFAHISLSDAASILARAAAGNTRALRGLGIATNQLPPHFATTGTAASRMATVLKLMNERIGGQAQAYAHTFAGKLDELKAAAKNAAAQVGSALLPALTNAATWIADTGIPAFEKFWKKVGGPAAKTAIGWVKDAWSILTRGQPNLPSAGTGAAERAQGGPMPVAQVSGGLAERAQGGPMFQPPPLAGWEKFILLVRTGVMDAFQRISVVWNKTIYPALVTFWNAVRPGFTQLWDAVKSIAGSLVMLWRAFAPVVGPVLKIALALIVLAFRAVALVLDKVVAPAIRSVASWFLTTATGVRRAWASLTSWLASIWGTVKSAVITAWNATISWIKGVPGKIRSALGNAAKTLYSWGWNVIQGLGSGILGWMKGIGSWINTHVVQPLVNAVKSFFGIKSPSTVMAGIGGNIVAGLLHGIASANPAALIGKIFGGMPQALGAMLTKGLVSAANLGSKALSALGKLGGNILSLLGLGGGPGGGTVSGTVAGWISAALRLVGAPMSWLRPLETLVSRESGGNPRAYNPTSVGGEHASGLFQTLPSTFWAYALAGHTNIWNPIDNAAAGIRYLRSRYGSPYNIPGLFGGGYAGYDAGGWLPPGVSVAVNRTGQAERVLSPGQNAGLEARLDRMIALLERLPARTGAATGSTISGITRTAAAAGYYGTRP